MGLLALRVLTRYCVEKVPAIIPALSDKVRLLVPRLYDGILFHAPLQRFMRIVYHVESYEVNEDNPRDH